MSDGKRIISALGGVDEKFIEEASQPEKLALDDPAFEPVRLKKKTNWKLWVGSVAALVAVAVGIGIGSGGTEKAMNSAADDRFIMNTVTTESAAVEEAAEEPALLISADSVESEANAEDVIETGAQNAEARVSNDEYLAKCLSRGLTAGVPQYPESPKNPDASANDMEQDWNAYMAASSAYTEAVQTKSKDVAGYEEALKTFTETTAKQFLTGKEDNTVYSPLNLYMALSMLAEITDGDSRQQILDLLDLGSIEAVREEARKLWLANYTDDGLTTLLLGSGAWIDDQFGVNYSVLDTLVEKYYAFYVVGDMRSEEMNQSFCDWLSQQTNGLLDEFISGEKFDPDTVLALASTIYYKAHWQDVFRESATEDAVFHALSGDQTVPFMNEKCSGAINRGSGFIATYKYMAGGERMYFVLPNEDVTVDQVLESDELWSTLNDFDQSKNTSYGVIVTLSLPKFDVSSGADLSEGLVSLGVSDVFNDLKSDFSPLTSAAGMYVGKVSHNARVKIDEEGVEAAAYTAILVCGSAMPIEYADFICDRPFIFVITNSDGAVLFMGTVSSIE